MQGDDGGILTVDPGSRPSSARRSCAGAPSATAPPPRPRWPSCARVAASDENIMPATIAAARAGVTTGEWAGALRDAFGEFRAPTGVGEAAAGAASGDLEAVREEVDRVSEALGRRLKILVGKPGLDGHSNGAEQIAVRARDAGMDVVYEGIRLTPAQIAASARAGGRPRRRALDPVGLAPRADPRRRGRAARARRRGARRRRRDHPRGRRRRAQGGRRGRGLHAQGLRPHADHARHRRRSWPRATASPRRRPELGRATEQRSAPACARATSRPPRPC